jgi:hypothetical protein
MNENKGYWGGGISIISQNFSKSPSIFFHPPDSSISQTSPKFILFNCFLDGGQKYRQIRWVLLNYRKRARKGLVAMENEIGNAQERTSGRRAPLRTD